MDHHRRGFARPAPPAFAASTAASGGGGGGAGYLPASAPAYHAAPAPHAYHHGLPVPPAGYHMPGASGYYGGAPAPAAAASFRAHHHHVAAAEGRAPAPAPSSRMDAAEYARMRESAAVGSSASIKPPAADAAAAATDADFKSYVLYVHRADARSPACVRALEALTRNPRMKLDTLIQDMEDLAAVPAWLDSAPTLVVRAERRAYKGDAAVEYIVEHVPAGAHAGAGRQRTGRRGGGGNAWAARNAWDGTDD